MGVHPLGGVNSKRHLNTLGIVDSAVFSWRHELQIDARVKSFAEANRKFEDSIIGSQDDDIARGVQNGGADLAVIQMLLHGIPSFVR
jgi:hypothetical protein